MPSPHSVGILGGMGPAAGADFVVLFVAACEAHLRATCQPVIDQAFPAHWLVQTPAPDRTAALLQGAASPLPAMAAALSDLSRVGVRHVAMACNTAHAWHADLQRACPQVELLHIVQETVTHLAEAGLSSVALLATQGTYQSGLYPQALAQAGIACHVPTDAEQAQLMRGIRDGVKAGDRALATALFTPVAEALVARHGSQAVVLACTEIPLALHTLPGHPAVRLINPAQVLAQALVRRAYHPTAAPEGSRPSNLHT